MKNYDWLSVHLFYSEEKWDTFIKEAVYTFINQPKIKRYLKGYFFIRYLEKGPHIRLRMQGEKHFLKNKLKPEIKKYFSDYFKKNPSIREEPKSAASFTKKEKWFKNNTIHFVRYEPEIERYGGINGIKISEQQFEASSRTVLSILKENNIWSYESALTYSIYLHLGICIAFELSVSETLYLLKKIFDNWFPVTVNFLKHFYNFDKGKVLILKAFNNSYAKLKPGIHPIVSVLLKAFKDNVVFEERWFNNWIKDMKLIYNKLEKLFLNDRLEFPGWFKFDKKKKFSRKKLMMFYLLGSYIHMTNNRIGIKNQDEAYIIFLLIKALKSISRKKLQR